jgi:hypothetical protein
MPKRVRHKKIQGEARRSPRRDERGSTTVIYAQGAFKPLTCSILDWSDHGLRIAVPPRTVLPARLWLLHHRNTTVSEARLLWRRDDVGGPALLDHCGLDRATNPLLDLLMSVRPKRGRPSFDQNLDQSLKGTFAVLRETSDNTAEFAGILLCS